MQICICELLLLSRFIALAVQLTNFAFGVCVLAWWFDLGWVPGAQQIRHPIAAAIAAKGPVGVCLEASCHWLCQTWGKLIATSHRKHPSATKTLTCKLNTFHPLWITYLRVITKIHVHHTIFTLTKKNSPHQNQNNVIGTPNESGRFTLNPLNVPSPQLQW